MLGIMLLSAGIVSFVSGLTTKNHYINSIGVGLIAIGTFLLVLL